MIQGEDVPLADLGFWPAELRLGHFAVLMRMLGVIGGCRMGLDRRSVHDRVNRLAGVSRPAEHAHHAQAANGNGLPDRAHPAHKVEPNLTCLRYWSL